jgi:hypothetical protein
MNGIAATLTSWSSLIRRAAPPRAMMTRLNRGSTLGEPGDAAQQRRVLETTLTLLAQNAPVPLLRLDEKADS